LRHPLTAPAIRQSDLRQMLTTRRRDMQDDVVSRLRDGRAHRPLDVVDTLESSDVDIQTEIYLACLQMRAETVLRIDEALTRLDAGDYGICSTCGGEIAERRLRALPFSVRCRTCEERRERESGDAGRATHRAHGTPLFGERIEV
jgi:DnaK suppressor protein